MSRKLLFSVSIHDCEVQTYRGSGPGGQHRNKVETGVRIIHHPSGAVAQACEGKSQIMNKRAAWKKLANDPKFRAWLRVEVSMRPANLLIEYIDAEGNWTKEE